MKNFTNGYIFRFAAIMVIAVAAILAFVALSLKEKQELNVKLEKMSNILSSVKVDFDKKNTEETFARFITESYVVNLKGEKVEGVEAFDVDLKKEVAKIDEINKLKEQLVERRKSPFRNWLEGFINFKALDKETILNKIAKAEATRMLPVYVSSKDDGSVNYVFPVRGKGLWGPIWGYVALEKDMNTLFGAVFDHKGETPGLGAEINKDFFQEPFEGKKLFAENNFKSIEVIKSGTKAASDYNVDAISGGTITSKGVEAMLFDCLEGYITFMETKRQ